MSRILTAAIGLSLTIGGSVMAQDVALDARASNPVTMGWMQGHPPAPEMTIRFTDPDRGQWWVSNDDHGASAARCVHGQTVWIDPSADMVIVRFESNPVANNSATRHRCPPTARSRST